MYRIRPWLYTGEHRESLDLALLRQHGIGAVLQLYMPAAHDGIASLYLDIADGGHLPPAQLREGADFIAAHKARGVLVACGLGIGRSATFVIAALKEIEGSTLYDAWQVFRTANPDVMPHSAMWQSLCDYYDEHVPFTTILLEALGSVMR
jgi:hypothetical protein